MQENAEKPISVEFSDKTNQLLEYIENTYLNGFVSNDGQGKKIIDKMRLAENTTKVWQTTIVSSFTVFWTQNLLNLSDLERHKIIQNFGNVKNKPETMIIDVGAGAESSSLTFMASADKVIVVITAEPTSFIDAYGLIKTAFLDHKMENFGVIVNMAHSQIQAKLNFDKFRAITQKFLDVNLKFIGGVSSSQRIKNSIISRKPIMSGNPNKSPDVEAFLNMATKLNTLATNKTGTIKFFEN